MANEPSDYGTHELRQMAHLQHVGAAALRDIAFLRRDDVPEILAFADALEAIARGIDKLTDGRTGLSERP